jgi:hypothetical protein
MRVSLLILSVDFGNLGNRHIGQESRLEIPLIRVLLSHDHSVPQLQSSGGIGSTATTVSESAHFFMPSLN